MGQKIWKLPGNNRRQTRRGSLREGPERSAVDGSSKSDFCEKYELIDLSEESSGAEMVATGV